MRSHWLRFVERTLWVVGVALLGYYGWGSLESALYQRAENRALDDLLQKAQQRAATDARPIVRRRRPPADGLIGRLEIPRLQVSVIVRAGEDARTLRLAVGWIPGTAYPGENGTVGLAGHRDTFFRRLADIHDGDDIRLVTPDGVFEYRVEAIDIVGPDDVWVLDDQKRPLVALVTCYPFWYTGPAPQRFVVRGVLKGS